MVTYDEAKRTINLKRHGIDLADCVRIFDAPMLTDEDTRLAYGEVRFDSLGWLDGCVVRLIWTERESAPRLISCRKGEKHDIARYFKAFF
ncbi:MAG: BrnT family toxin [Zoogloeaceae bacterium]|jgi:uncharacterized DUF497 family protein|nr:BrnT family toxin [Zoogloeaceae bacterium]